jgi:IS5 family transposase
MRNSAGRRGRGNAGQRQRQSGRIAGAPDDPGDVYADSAFRGKVFASAVVARGPKVVQTSAWGGPGDDTLRRLTEWNWNVNRVRCRIEKIFGTWKRSYGLRRLRWRGIAKGTLQVRLTATAYNLKRTMTIPRSAAT